jgi:hypothetical protein
VPILSPPALAQYLMRAGIAPKASEVGHSGALPQHFSDRLGWQELVQLVSRVHLQLPREDRDRSLVLGRNYGHSGALEYGSRSFELPPVYGRHNNYWLWGPPPVEGDAVVIAVGLERESLEELFQEVVAAGRTDVPFAQESRIPIWVCRGLKRPIGEIWDQIKVFI